LISNFLLGLIFLSTLSLSELVDFTGASLDSLLQSLVVSLLLLKAFVIVLVLLLHFVSLSVELILQS